VGSNFKTYDSSFFTATRARNNRQTVSTIPKLCRRICEISQREDVHGSDFGADVLRVKRAGGGGKCPILRQLGLFLGSLKLIADQQGPAGDLSRE